MLYTKQEKQILIEALKYYAKAMKKKGYYAHDYQYNDKAIEAEMIVKRLESSSKSEEMML